MLPVRIEKFFGTQAETQIAKYISQIAQLRLDVFRDFPHLYNSTLAHEEQLLSLLAQAPDFFLMLVFDAEHIVGASIALPLETVFNISEVPNRLIQQGYAPQTFMYFYQSTLKKPYRNKGIGGQFFTEREHYTKTLNRFNYTCFYAIQRPLDHPRCPSDYLPLDDFWGKRGYFKLSSMETSFSWQDLGESIKSPKSMHFWLKKI